MLRNCASNKGLKFAIVRKMTPVFNFSDPCVDSGLIYFAVKNKQVFTPLHAEEAIYLGRNELDLIPPHILSPELLTKFQLQILSLISYVTGWICRAMVKPSFLSVSLGDLKWKLSKNMELQLDNLVALVKCI